MIKSILNTKPISFFKRIVFIIGLLLGHFNHISAQSYPFRHYTIKDGLPSSEIYHVFQDSKGYIWFATDNGVSRYDGYEFKNFTTEYGLPDNTVFEIYEDYKNRIWFIPHSAQFSYYIGDTITQYKYNEKIKKLYRTPTNPYKGSFIVDSADNVLFGDRDNGGYFIDSAGNIVKMNKPGSTSIFLIHEDDIMNFRNRPYDPTNNLLSIKKNGKELFILPNEPPLRELFLHHYSLAELNDNDLYIGSNKLLINLKDMSTFSYKIVDDIIIWLNTDSEDNVWIGTHNGAYCYNSVNESSKPIHHFLKGKNVSSILRDKEGGFWFTTLYNGVYYLPNIYTENLDQRDGFPSDNVNTITSDSVNIWLGLESDIIGLKSNKIDKLIKLENSFIIHKLFSDIQNKTLWISSSGSFFYKKNLNKVIVKDRTGKQNYKSSPNDYLKDGFRNIWAASHGGLLKYNKEINAWMGKNSISSKINSIILLNENSILMGCNNGLWRYSIPDNLSKYLGEEDDLLSDQIVCITGNSFHDNFWLGTKSKGVVVYDKDTIFNITTRDELSNNYVTSLYSKDSIMWIATTNGLNKITFQEHELKTNYKIETFNTDHGLASNEINDIYISDSAAYIGTKEGLTIIDYNKIESNNCYPPIYIKNISILDKDTLIRDHYNLPHNQNSISIEFVGLMYRNNKNKKYKYQLNQPGKQAKWVETTDNYINFSSLSPGKYNFKVIAINEDGYESNEPAELSFTINPPYWKTWWFFSLLILGIIIFIAGILLIIYFVKVSEIKRRNELERKLLLEINRFRQQALSQQMNPHFIFNTLNSIQFYIYDNDINSSTQYLSKFSKLMRVILNNSQHDTIPIQNELEAMKLYLELESMRLDNQLNYEIITNDIDVELYQIHPLLIQPYVENSIWHGLVHKEGEKNVKIEVRNNKGSILCIIEDDGIGRQKAMEIKEKKNKGHISYGTNITGKRIDSINKLFNQDFKVEYTDLKDDKGNACGTKVLLQIPKISN